ncbi:MAG: Z1 domain-containing protein [Streptococcus sp.]
MVEDLPEDLYEAAYYFLLLNAIRDYRGDLTEHRSMMVHISLYTNVQNQIQEMLNDVVRSGEIGCSKLR